MKGRIIVIVILVAGVATAATAFFVNAGSDKRKLNALPKGDLAHAIVALDTAPAVATKPHPPGTILIAGQSYAVLVPIKLVSIAPISIANGLELLTSRISIVRRATGKQPQAGTGYPGGNTSCTTGGWPPRSLGVTTDPKGLTLNRGDVITTMFYVRIAKPGQLSLAGTVFHYTDQTAGLPYAWSVQDVTFTFEGADPPRAVGCGGALDPWLIY